MEVKILNIEILQKTIENYIWGFFNSDDPDNNQKIKLYFGDNRYNKEDIEFRSKGILITSIYIDPAKFNSIKNIKGIIRTEGMYWAGNGNRARGRGFSNDVSFSVEIENISSEFKNLDFSSR